MQRTREGGEPGKWMEGEDRDADEEEEEEDEEEVQNPVPTLPHPAGLRRRTLGAQRRAEDVRDGPRREDVGLRRGIARGVSAKRGRHRSGGWAPANERLGRGDGAGTCLCGDSALVTRCSSSPESRSSRGRPAGARGGRGGRAGGRARGDGLRRPRTLTASTPLMRAFLSCSRMMMYGRPNSSNTSDMVVCAVGEGVQRTA